MSFRCVRCGSRKQAQQGSALFGVFVCVCVFFGLDFANGFATVVFLRIFSVQRRRFETKLTFPVLSWDVSLGYCFFGEGISSRLAIEQW